MARNSKQINDDGNETTIDVGQPIETDGETTTGSTTTGSEQPVEFSITDGNSIIPDGKRKRGRPRKNTETSETFIKPQKSKVTKQDEKEAKELADFIIQSFEYMSALVLAQNTSFNEMELFLLKPSLIRTLEKMDFKQLEKANRILDPLFILGALALWGNRVIIQSQREKQKNAVNRRETTFPNSDNQQSKPDDENAFNLSSIGETIASTIGGSST